ncbi:hypothetical protein APUTEX25_003871, partial [Auxenochlorella protothecoides]
ARGFAAAGASANLTVTPTQPFEWYSISTINPETLEFCVPSKSAFCQALAAVECLPEGVDQCTADADGNIGSGNVGSNNLGNDNIGDYNKGNGNHGTGNTGSYNWGLDIVCNNMRAGQERMCSVFALRTNDTIVLDAASAAPLP